MIHSQSPSPSPSRLSFTPNSSDSKAESIVKNFYIKAAQTIIQSRQPQQDVDEKKRTNRWFNMNTREHPDSLRSELKYWITRALVSPITQPPPLIIEVYLDVSNIPPDKQLELQGGRRLDQPCIVDLHEPVKRNRIILENWILTLNHPLPTQALDLGNVYKRSILFFRTLYAFARLLPAYRTNQRINTGSAGDDGSIGYRLTSSVAPMPDELALDEGPDSSVVTQSLDNIVTPLGTLGLQVQYRANCDFVIHDSLAELDPSTQLMDLGHHYFEPTIAKYTLGSSDDDNGESTKVAHKTITKWPPVPRRSESARITKTTTTTEQRHGSRRPLSTTSRGTRPPALSLRPLSMTDDENLFTRSAEPPSKLHVSPFKSPTLSSSSQHSSTFSLHSIKGDDNQRKNTTRRFSSSFDRHQDLHYHSAPTGQHTTNNRPTSPTGSIRSRRSYSATRRLSIASEQDEELEDFVRSLNLRRSPGFQSRILSDEIEEDLYAPSLEASTVYRSKKALARFQNMRGMHDSLSQSLISSTILSHPEQQQQQQQMSVTKEQSVRASKEDIIASNSSSLLSSSVLKGSPMSRLYQPRAPSPLHTEQPSTTDIRTSPVKIPLQRYEQHTPDSNSDASSEHRDLYPSFMYSSQRSQSNETHPLPSQFKDPFRPQLEPVSIIESQPQPKRMPQYTSRRESTRLTVDTESTSSSSGNDKEDEEPTSPTAQDEDDDSLVFKMSELGLYEHK